jgi:exonuclease VII small subunit
VSEHKACKCVNANLNSLVAIEEATMWVVCCDECGRHGPWAETEAAAWAAWDADHEAVAKAREAINAALADTKLALEDACSQYESGVELCRDKDKQIAALREALEATAVGLTIDELRAHPDALKTMRLVPLERLREIEWSGDEDGWPSCPACGGLQGCAHKPDCWLAAAIAGKETP